MFLKRLYNLKNSLLFRLTLLYAVSFTVLSVAGFLIFYYRIYAIAVEGLDHELRADAEKYSALMKETGLEAVKSAIFEEVDTGSPEEDFYRLFNFKGDILTSTDMSYWGAIEAQGIFLRMQNEGLTYLTHTITVAGSDDAGFVRENGQPLPGAHL